MTSKQLKVVLETCGLSKTGNKEVLLKRIMDAFAMAEIDSNVVVEDKLVETNYDKTHADDTDGADEQCDDEDDYEGEGDDEICNGTGDNENLIDIDDFEDNDRLQLTAHNEGDLDYKFLPEESEVDASDEGSEDKSEVSSNDGSDYASVYRKRKRNGNDDATPFTSYCHNSRRQRGL